MGFRTVEWEEGEMVRARWWTTVAAVALLAGGSSMHSADASGPQGEVEIVGFRFLPPVSAVESGASVTWVNREPTDIPHDVVAVAYAPPDGMFSQVEFRVCPWLLPGETCTRNDEGDEEPLVAGTYLYVCTVSPAHTALMQGALIVQ